MINPEIEQALTDKINQLEIEQAKFIKKQDESINAMKQETAKRLNDLIESFELSPEKILPEKALQKLVQVFGVIDAHHHLTCKLKGILTNVEIAYLFKDALGQKSCPYCTGSKKVSLFDRDYQRGASCPCCVNAEGHFQHPLDTVERFLIIGQAASEVLREIEREISKNPKSKFNKYRIQKNKERINS